MKSQILNKGDRLIITQEFIDNNKHLNPVCNSIWQLGSTAKVYETSDYSTVRIVRGLWNVWVTNPIAENMKAAYDEQKKDH